VNAIVYTQEGQITIKTFALPDGQFVGLEIIDTGSGISPEDQNHILDRFYRGQNAGQSNIPGTGLGLAIVKEIIDLHGGQIKIESKLEEGTAVYVYLPISPPETQPDHSPK
jgi:signal transduction histidine kinase